VDRGPLGFGTENSVGGVHAAARRRL
jgi:hypothetical protein